MIVKANRIELCQCQDLTFIFLLATGACHLGDQPSFANEPHLREFRRHQRDRVHLHPPKERPQKVRHDLRLEDADRRLPVRGVPCGQAAGQRDQVHRTTAPAGNPSGRVT